MKIFIAGIPGTGKTSIGDYLRDTHSFIHVDMEGDNKLQELSVDPDRFLTELINSPQKVVITWGFAPNDWAIDKINKLKNNGFKLIWFDGNRKTALKKFIEREEKKGEKSLKKAKLAFSAQMNAIDSSNVIVKIEPIIVNTFTKDADFKPCNMIVEEIFNLRV